MAITFTSIEKVAFAEDRLREAHFWAKRSMAERVIAGWELAEKQYPLIGSPAHEPEKRTGITFRRTQRGQR